MGSSISGFVLLRQTLEVINPEAVVTREDVPGEVTLEAVPVVALRLPLLQGTRSRAQVWVTPPSDPPTAAGEETTLSFLRPDLERTVRLTPDSGTLNTISVRAPEGLNRTYQQLKTEVFNSL